MNMLKRKIFIKTFCISAISLFVGVIQAKAINLTPDSANGIFTMDQAIDAWLDTYEVQLAYIRVPAAIDYSKPEYKPLMDYGISYLYKLTLGYALNRENYLLGIDAKIGKAVAPDWGTTDEGLSYSDIAGHWAAEYINRASKYGWINGYEDGTFKPDRDITRAEAMTLVNSVLTRGTEARNMHEDMVIWTDNTEDKWYYEEVQEATNAHNYTKENNVETWTEMRENRDWKALEIATFTPGAAVEEDAEEVTKEVTEETVTDEAADETTEATDETVADETTEEVTEEVTEETVADETTEETVDETVTDEAVVEEEVPEEAAEEVVE